MARRTLAAVAAGMLAAAGLVVAGPAAPAAAATGFRVSAADYWLAVKSALQGQEAYAIINIGNEPLGNNSASQWAGATRAAVQKLRNGGGVEYLDMVYGFNVNNRSWWGDRIIWGTNGWKQTSRQATVYN
ncbi:hypothetical protein [Dactylosporangium sp. NPDC006015]|uniref:hypothetical protein n=1 Tax=Dactylosporangium sp. NPDC006015 TaxID=3154576 RepID=UPI0033A0ED61